MKNSGPNFFPGFEPDYIQTELTPYFATINSIFPSKHIDFSRWDSLLLNHKTKYLCEILGYTHASDFLSAYGYTISDADIYELNYHIPCNKTQAKTQRPVFNDTPFYSDNTHNTYKEPPSKQTNTTHYEGSKREKKHSPVGTFIIILLIIGLLGGGGYYYYQNYARSFIDNPKKISKAADSVLILNCYDKSNTLVSSGSGFAALDNNIIVTNYHVIEGISTIEAKNEEGKTFKFDIDDALAWDSHKDIAIFKVSGTSGIELLPLGESKNLMKGSKIVVVGSPEGFVNTVSSGIFSGVYTDDGVDYIQFDASVSHGSSGGPVFDNTGKVIGMTTWALTDANGLNFAVTEKQIQELWNKYQSGYFNNGNAKKQFEAEMLLNKGEFDQAKKMFDTLGLYEMSRECIYQKGTYAFDHGDYPEAMLCFDALRKQSNYKDSYECWLHATFYRVTEIIKTEDENNYSAALSSSLLLIENDFPQADELFDIVSKITYDYMEKNYNKGNYEKIRTLVNNFAEIDYKDSKQYRILLKRHQGSGLIPPSGFFSKNFSITNDELKILLNNIELADTKEALLCNHNTARKFLTGTWVANTGQQFSIDDSGYLTDGMPRVIYGEGYWEVNNSILQWYTSYDSTRKNDKKITIITRDKIEIYCYANNQTYTLTRQKDK